MAKVHPYPISKDSQGFDVFATDHQLIYKCQFINISSLLEEFGISDFQIYSFDFSPEGYNSTSRLRKPQDARIAVTIANLLHQKLQEPNSAVLFTCDDTWQKPESRQYLFERWHHMFSTNTELVLFPNENFKAYQEATGVKTMIGGILMRADYEHRTLLLTLMDEVLPVLHQEKNDL
jgi:hypothetical protein